MIKIRSATVHGSYKKLGYKIALRKLLRQICEEALAKTVTEQYLLFWSLSQDQYVGKSEGKQGYAVCIV